MFHNYLQIKLKYLSGNTGKYINIPTLYCILYINIYVSYNEKNIAKFSNIFAIFRRMLNDY